MNSPQTVVLRLLLSALMGGAVGLEREVINRPAGFRTHILVCVGSALMMIVSTDLYYQFRGVASADPGRIAAQVVSGIGFLGAGTILREGVSIKGLTTAASLWTIAGVGLAVGLGLLVPAVTATAITFLTLSLLNRVENRLVTGKKYRRFRVQMLDNPGQLGALGTALGTLGVGIKQVRLQPAESGQVGVELTVQLPPDQTLEAVIRELMAAPGIRSVGGEAD